MAVVMATDEQGEQPVDARRWVSLARSVLEAQGVSERAELSLAFVSEDAMGDLNRRYAGEDGPTDVLAFPLDEAGRGGGDGPPALLGDLVICPEVAARNAARHTGAYDDEMALLVVHGILHLMGMDHEDPSEAQLMQRRERELMERFHRPATPSRR